MSPLTRWQRIHWGYRTLIILHVLALCGLLALWAAVANARRMILDGIAITVNGEPMDRNLRRKHLAFDGVSWDRESLPKLRFVLSYEGDAAVQGIFSASLSADAIGYELEARAGGSTTRTKGVFQPARGRACLPVHAGAASSDGAAIGFSAFDDGMQIIIRSAPASRASERE